MNSGKKSAKTLESQVVVRVRQRIDRWRDALSEQINEHPVRTVAIALGTGYLLAGGLFSRLTARLVGLGMRIGLRVGGPRLVTQSIVALELSREGRHAARTRSIRHTCVLRCSGMPKALLIALLAGLDFACAHEASHVQPLHSPEAQPLGLKTPAPVNPEVRDLPNVSASWFKPSGSAARLYLLEVGPHSTKHPPLVLFHGAGSGGNRVFYPVLAALSSKRHVIAVDLPGFGRSERRGDDFAPDQMVRQVASVVDALGVRRIDVLGHSSGGPLALLFAAQSPKLVRRLVLRRSGRRAAARDAATEPAARATQ